jgi:hypothetical protein
MAEVPDYLVPTDGLTNSSIMLEGIDFAARGGANFRFRITDEQQQYVSTYMIHVPAQNKSMDHMLAEAHRRLRDVLRQWLHMTNVIHRHHEKRAAGWSQTDTQ